MDATSLGIHIPDADPRLNGLIPQLRQEALEIDALLVGIIAGSTVMTTLGDMEYGGASGILTRLAGNITATKKFLSQTGTGSVSAAPIWLQPASADLSDASNIPLKNGANVFTNTNQFGSGDAVQYGSNVTSGQRIQVAKGTAAAPDTSANPLIKVERTIYFTDASATAAGVFGDGAECFAGIVSSIQAVNNSECQPVGLVGLAKTDSSSNPAGGPENDACGGYFGGRIIGSGTGVGLGAYCAGRRDNSTGNYTGLEVQAQNYGGVDTTYSASGYSSNALWVNTNGTADTAAAIIISNPFGRQFTNGLAFTGQVTGGKTGGISANSIRDDSAAVTTLLVNGSHTNAVDTRGATLSGSALMMASGQHVTWTGGADISNSGSSVLVSGIAITGLTLGSALFAGASGAVSQDNANFFYSSTNHNLGLGTVTPGTMNGTAFGGVVKLHLSASGSAYIGCESTTSPNQAGVFFNLAYVSANARVWSIDIAGASGNTTTNFQISTLSDVGVGTTRFVLTRAGALKLSGYGAGTAAFDSSGNITSAPYTVAGPTVLRTYTFPDANSTIARTDTGQTFTGTNNFGSLLPTTTDTYDLGSATKLWRKGWLSELDAVLFAQNTASVVGGWLIISKNEGLIPVGQDVGSGDTTIDFGQSMTINDFVVFRAALQVEYVKVISLSAGTRYNVTRDLDGSGANAWPAGSVYLVLGNTGNGRVELNANATPRISMFSQGATYNAQTEMLRIGDLNGSWNVSVETYGFAVGQYGVSGKSSLRIDDSGIHFYNNITERIRLLADGSGYLANTAIAWDTAGNLTMTGNAVIAGWTISSTSLTSGSGATTVGLSSGGATAIYAGSATPSTAPFQVTAAGAVTATSGTIAGWTISSDGFVKDTGTNATSMGLYIPDVPFYAGATFANRGAAPFRVTPAGAMTSTSGAIGGWTIGATRISSTHVFIDNAGEYISLGTTPPTSYGNNVGVFIEGANSGRMSLYKDADNYLQWTNAALNMAGSLRLSGAASNIAIGSTPPTNSTTGTGIWIDRTGIFSLSGSTLVAKIDSSGLTLGFGTSANIFFQSAGTNITSMIGDAPGAGSRGFQILTTGTASDVGAITQITAINNASTKSAEVKIVAIAANNPYIDLWAPAGTFLGVLIGANGAPSAMCDVRGTLWATGALKFSNYGAGTATFDASGNITSVSDERLKEKVGDFTRGLDALRSIQPVLYRWKAGDESGCVYPGFFAQNVEASMPESVGRDSRGYLTLQDRGLLGALVNSTKELDTRSVEQLALIEKLQGEVKGLREQLANKWQRPIPR